MQHSTAKAATAQVGESVETDATPVQSQPLTAPDGNTAETASAAANAEATTTNPQAITAANASCATHVAQPKQEILPPESSDAGLDDISSEAARKLDDDALIGECKRRVESIFTSQRRLYRDASNLAVIYEEMVERFRCQNLKGENRDDKPTLRQAFDQAGWSYDAARKFHQRYQSWKTKQLVTPHEKRETLRVAAGDTIENDKGDFVVKGVSKGGMQATVAKKTEGGEEEVTTECVQLYDDDGVPQFEKVPLSIPVLKKDSLYRFNSDPDGKPYRCTEIEFCKKDGRCIARVDFSVDNSVKSLAEVAEEKEAQKKKAEEEKRAERNKAKAAEEAKRREVSKAAIAAENAARDLAKIKDNANAPAKAKKRKAKPKDAAKKNPAVVASDAVQTFQIRHDVDNTPQGYALYGSNAPTESICIGTLAACEARKKEVLDGYAAKAAVAA